jgi:hypothetical protein
MSGRPSSSSSRYAPGQFDDAYEAVATNDDKARLTGGEYYYHSYNPYNNNDTVSTSDYKDNLEEEHYLPTNPVYDSEGAARQMLMRSIEDGEEPPNGGFYEPDGRLIPLTSIQIRNRWKAWLKEEKDIDKLRFSEPHPLPYGFERGPRRHSYTATPKLPTVSYPPASASFDHQAPKKKKGFVDLTTFHDNNTNSSDDDTSSPLLAKTTTTTTESSKKKAKKQFAYADGGTSSSLARKGEEQDPYALKIDKKYHIKPMSDGHYFKNHADREDHFNQARFMPRDDDMPAMTKEEEEELYWNLQDYFYDPKKTMRDPTPSSSYFHPT